eukprot:SAG31_NODE_460_length_15364_cov_11.851294_15_plen_97_part_00
MESITLCTDCRTSRLLGSHLLLVFINGAGTTACAAVIRSCHLLLSLELMKSTSAKCAANATLVLVSHRGSMSSGRRYALCADLVFDQKNFGVDHYS